MARGRLTVTARFSIVLAFQLCAPRVEAEHD